MQVDPIKPMLKPHGTKHLKLKCDELLSSFAFKFNLRRYTVEGTEGRIKLSVLFNTLGYPGTLSSTLVGQCRLTLSNPR